MSLKYEPASEPLNSGGRVGGFGFGEYGRGSHDAALDDEAIDVPRMCVCVCVCACVCVCDTQTDIHTHTHTHTYTHKHTHTHTHTHTHRVYGRGSHYATLDDETIVPATPPGQRQLRELIVYALVLQGYLAHKKQLGGMVEGLTTPPWTTKRWTFPACPPSSAHIAAPRFRE